MSCKYEKYIDSYLDGDLSKQTSKKFTEHLNNCSSCSNKISEILDFNNNFASSFSEPEFKSNKDSILSKAQSMKKKFDIHLMFHSINRYALPAAAIIIICCFIYYFKPIYKYVSSNILNKSTTEQTSVKYEKIEISSSDLDNIISNYLIKFNNPSSEDIKYDNKTFEVHKIYGTMQKDGKLYVYIYSIVESYIMKQPYYENPTLTNSSLYPALLIIENKNNEYVVSNYKQPMPDESSETFIKKVFPQKYASIAINDLKNNSDMKNTINNKVNIWAHFLDMNMNMLNFSSLKNTKVTIDSKQDCSFDFKDYSIIGNNGQMSIDHYIDYYKKDPTNGRLKEYSIISSKDIITPLGSGKFYNVILNNTPPMDMPNFTQAIAFIRHKTKEGNDYYIYIRIRTKDNSDKSVEKAINFINNITFK